MELKGNIFLLTLFSVLLAGCNRDPLNVDVSGIKVDATIKRFEKDLFRYGGTSGLPDVKELGNKYGSFFDVFTHRIINIPEGPDTLIANQLSLFINDVEVKDIYRLTDSAFTDLSDVEKNLKPFLQHLGHYYPEQPIPGIVTYISAFNYAVITTDSVIGIGLDMFLGQDVMYYARLGIPKYMSTRFRREYIVPSAIKAWFQSEYDIAEVKNECLSHMIYQGKLLYFSEVMAPGMHDSLITGYTAAQLEWCKENEENIWSFLIENKLLFNTNASEYAKYVNEGPATGGFPKEAPGKIAAWTGWQIVKEYARHNSEMSLQELLNEKDSQKILEQSGYKPQK